MVIKPLADRVLVLIEEAETKSAGGIIIPDTAQEKTQVGKVIAVGDDKDAIKVKNGDRVMYDKYAGTTVKIAILTVVPAYLSYITLSPFLTLIASLSSPTAITLPTWVFSCAVSGIIIPPALFVSASSISTKTRSAKGLITITSSTFEIIMS